MIDVQGVVAVDDKKPVPFRHFRETRLIGAVAAEKVPQAHLDVGVFAQQLAKFLVAFSRSRLVGRAEVSPGHADQSL